MSKLGVKRASVGTGRRRRGRMSVKVSALPRGRKGGGRKGKAGAKVY